VRRFATYLAWQAPGWLLVGLALGWLASAGVLSASVAVAIGLVVVARDLVLYPALSSALGKTPYRSAPIGAAGEAVEPLAPSGYVRVSGELWRAETAGGGAVPRGARVVVRDARGLTLIVEEVAGRSAGAGRG